MATDNAEVSDTYANSTAMTDFSSVAVPGTKGIWFTEDLNIADLGTINMTMGLAYDLVDPYGVLGLQYKPPSDADKAVWSVMTQMIPQGALVTQAYSIAIGGTNPEAGSILFGAIDTDKYVGDLKSLDIYHTSANDFRAVVTLASVQANSTSGIDDITDSLPVSTGIWFGRPGLLLPPEVAFNMWAVVGAEYWSEVGSAMVPCSMKDSGGSFTFKLGAEDGPTVTVPMRNLIAAPSGYGDSCRFLVGNETNPLNYYLGEAFLRSAYVVFDLANEKIAIADPNPDSTESEIVPFAGLAAPIPSTVSVTSQLTRAVTQSPTMTEMPSATKSFAAAAGFQSMTSATSDATQTADAAGGESDTGGLPRGTTIGIGVGVGVGVAALAGIAGAFFFIRKRTRDQRVSDKSAYMDSPPSDVPPAQIPLYPTELEPIPPRTPELHHDSQAAEVNSTPFHHYQGGGYSELPSSNTSGYYSSNGWDRR